MSNAMNIVSDCSQCENDVSLNARASGETDLHAAGVGRNPQSSEGVECQPVNYENTKWQNHVINEVTLPKFVDSSKQNAVQFRYEL
jgi:hypothetical protein